MHYSAPKHRGSPEGCCAHPNSASQLVHIFSVESPDFPEINIVNQEWAHKNTFEALSVDDDDDGEENSEHMQPVREENSEHMQPVPSAGRKKHKKFIDWRKGKRMHIDEFVQDKPSEKVTDMMEALSTVMPVLIAGEDSGGDVMALRWQEQTCDGWTKVSSIVDSGCVEHVAPPELAPQVKIEPSEGSKRGRSYTVANGEDLPNLGQKSISVVTESGDQAVIKTQIAQVAKPLTSVGETCDRGNLVVFSAHGGAILNLHTKGVIPFQRRNRNYELDYYIKHDQGSSAMDFHRQGS